MKNYTSSVPPERSVAEIEEALVRAGAKHISKEYASGEVVAVSFMIANPETQGLMPIRLPADPEAVFGVLKKRVRRWQQRMEKRVREQARRTAWRLMLDWVQVQMSLIEMKQCELAQVFMPYIWTGKGTLYHLLKEQKFQALTYNPTPTDEDSQ